MIKSAVEKIKITPEESVPLQGYGDRTHNSEGIHDELFAYIWYVQSNGEENPIIWIVLDVCLFSVQTADSLRKDIEKKIHVPWNNIILSTTHTHSGPAARFLHMDTSSWAVRFYSLLVERLSFGCEGAKEKAIPCEIEVRVGNITFASNRRNKKLPVDDRLIHLTLISEKGTKMGQLFYYSCHLTALGVDNYWISSDWVGIVRDIMEKEYGTPVGFIQGAEGNTDPIIRGELDMADPDQAVGVSFEAMEEAGKGFAESLLSILKKEPDFNLSLCTIRNSEVYLPLRYGGLADDAIQEKIEEWKHEFSAFLNISPSEVPEDLSINALIKEECRKKPIPRDKIRVLVAKQFTYCSFINIYKIGGDLINSAKGTIRIPLSIIDLQNLAFIGIPGEVLIENNLEVSSLKKEKMLLIAGLFNGWTGYMPHTSNYKEKNSQIRYETVSTMLAENASDVLIKKIHTLV